jgi:nicotinamidase-related amidase
MLKIEGNTSETKKKSRSNMEATSKMQENPTSNPNRYAILVNDMLNDFIYGSLKSERAGKIIPQIKIILDIARRKFVPIFYCNDEHIKSDPELKIWGYHAMKGTDGCKIIRELEPSSTGIDYIVPKRSYGSFDNTTLETLLKSAYKGEGATALIITGIHTHICVKHTVYGAFIRGYDLIIVPEDAVTAFTEKDHKMGLEYIKKNYGVLIESTSEVIKKL